MFYLYIHLLYFLVSFGFFIYTVFDRAYGWSIIFGLQSAVETLIIFYYLHRFGIL